MFAAKAASGTAFKVYIPQIFLDIGHLERKLASFSRTRLRFPSQGFD